MAALCARSSCHRQDSLADVNVNLCWHLVVKMQGSLSLISGMLGPSMLVSPTEMSAAMGLCPKCRKIPGSSEDVRCTSGDVQSVQAPLLLYVLHEILVPLKSMRVSPLTLLRPGFYPLCLGFSRRLFFRDSLWVNTSQKRSWDHIFPCRSIWKCAIPVMFAKDNSP